MLSQRPAPHAADAGHSPLGGRVAAPFTRETRRWRPSAASKCATNRREVAVAARSHAREDGRPYRANQMDRDHRGLLQLGGSIPKAIDAREMQERLDSEGVVAVRGAFSKDWTSSLVDAIEDVCTSPNGQGVVVGAQRGSSTAGGDPQFLQFALEGASGRSEKLLWHIRDSVAADLAATALHPLPTSGAQVSFQSDDIFIKEPGCMERTPWHRDTSCVPFSSPGSGERLVNIWIAADAMLAATSLRVLAGSHRWSPGGVGSQLQEDFACALLGDDWREAAARVLPLPATLSEADREDFILTFALEQMDLMDPSAFARYMGPVSFNLLPGDCLVFHRQAIHGSNGNHTSHPRRALSLRWSTVPKDAPDRAPRYTQNLYEV